MKNGVELDVAMALEPDEATAWAVIFGEMESGKDFDWDGMCWPE